MDAAWLYLLFVVLGLPFLAVYDAAAAIFRSANRTAATMYVSAAANLVNLSGNAVGIFVLQAGIARVLIVAHNLMAIALHPAAFNLAGALRAAGDVGFTMVVGIASLAVCRLSCAWSVGVVAGWGIYGVWLGMEADWLARSIAFGLRWHSRAWESRAVTEGDAAPEQKQGQQAVANNESEEIAQALS